MARKLLSQAWWHHTHIFPSVSRLTGKQIPHKNRKIYFVVQQTIFITSRLQSRENHWSWWSSLHTKLHFTHSSCSVKTLCGILYFLLQSWYDHRRWLQPRIFLACSGCKFSLYISYVLGTVHASDCKDTSYGVQFPSSLSDVRCHSIVCCYADRPVIPTLWSSDNSEHKLFFFFFNFDKYTRSTCHTKRSMENLSHWRIYFSLSVKEISIKQKCY
jgi:hypothetical protein